MTDDRVLIIDDEPSSAARLAALLRSWDYRRIASTCEPGNAPVLFEVHRPDLVLLDLRMPEPDGFELLNRIPRELDGIPVPVLVLTSDDSREAKRRALAMGARDFVAKPFDPDEVRMRVANLLKTRRLEIDLRDYGLHLEQRVAERTRELDVARRETLAKLALAAEFRDDSTGEHIFRVGRTAALLAHELGGSSVEVETLRQAAPLHDVGKIGVPDAILLKQGRLTDDEFERMKRHTHLGSEILGGSGSPVLRMASEVALTHHERWDGSGYPRGLVGDEIPIAGRLVAVADVFDALTQQRPYKDPWPIEIALAEIEAQCGSDFDPQVVAAFAQLDPEELCTPVHADERAWVT